MIISGFIERHKNKLFLCNAEEICIIEAEQELPSGMY